MAGPTAIAVAPDWIMDCASAKKRLSEDVYVLARLIEAEVDDLTLRRGPVADTAHVSARCTPQVCAWNEAPAPRLG